VEVLQRCGEPAAAVGEHGDQQVDREPDDPKAAAAHREATAGQRHAAGAAAILDLRGVEPCSLAKAHLGVLPRCARLLNVEDGADGARTRDLLAASQTLSQLSYGPFPRRIVATRLPKRARRWGRRPRAPRAGTTRATPALSAATTHRSRPA